MDQPHRLLLTCSALLLAACGGAAAAPDSAPGDLPSGEIAPAGYPTEAESQPRDGTSDSDGSGSADAAGEAGEGAAGAPPPPALKTRMEHCMALGPAMQQVQQVGPIANASDAAKLKAMATELRREMQPLVRARPGMKEFVELRDSYVETSGAMATALDDAAATTVTAELKAAVERFRKLEPKLTDIIEKLNAICGASR